MWWDNGTPDTTQQVAIKGTKRITDANNVVSREVPDTDDNDIFSSLQTKSDNVNEGDNDVMNEFLNNPSPIRRTIPNDESTIASNITMDTRMEMVESNIGNLENSVNLMAHMLKKIM